MLPHILDTHVAMEATGPYYFQLARFVYESGIRVSVVNPLVIRRFAQMTSPRLWEPPTAAIQSIRNLETYLEGLKQRRHMLSSQLHAFEAAGTIDKLLYKQKTLQIKIFVGF